ncbi:hypothetical protein R3P38DRAFT_2883046 [Favolaschia claudopus]|uniref:Uncharacterized protein n=1 Tax=Favolaschia claudopus TaxID=2862362 RepID=A0AAW0D1J1_9AGAR
MHHHQCSSVSRAHRAHQEQATSFRLGLLGTAYSICSDVGLHSLYSKLKNRCHRRKQQSPSTACWTERKITEPSCAFHGAATRHRHQESEITVASRALYSTSKSIVSLETQRRGQFTMFLLELCLTPKAVGTFDLTVVAAYFDRRYKRDSSSQGVSLSSSRRLRESIILRNCFHWTQALVSSQRSLPNGDAGRIRLRDQRTLVASHELPLRFFEFKSPIRNVSSSIIQLSSSRFTFLSQSERHQSKTLFIYVNWHMSSQLS